LICLAALVVILPAMMMIPLPALLGEVARANVGGLRSALVVACVVTLVSLPLTVVGNLRQAYQELHISNMVGAVSSGALCAALVMAAHAGAGLAVFVACFAGIPLAASIVNGELLLAGRRYLLTGWRSYQFRQSLALVGDGVRFLAAAFSYLLVYQWPVYLMARSRPTAESAAFAVSVQMVLLPLSFLAGIVQPFWGTTADAAARGDVAWVRAQVKKLRCGGVAAGLVISLVIAVWGEEIVRLWLGKRVELGWSLRLCAGTYLTLAIWEYLHFLLGLGVGRIREASMMVFARSVGFAVVAPGLIALGGGTGLWLGLCCSVAAYTAWRMPRLMGRFVGAAGK
jgi:O-antigen/teichoic acid export membrane protein